MTTAAVPCPPSKPLLSGPREIGADDSYTISWTNVLGSGATSDVFLVERARDAGFTKGLEQHKTSRSSFAFPPLKLPPAAGGMVYHRVSFRNPCATAYGSLIVSETLAIPVRATCPVPPSTGEIRVSPETPPAGTTYVLSWLAPAIGVHEAEESPIRLRYRLRRVSADGVKESVTERGSASFSDPPGTYLYDVRAESSCGTVGPWSPVLRVVVVPPPSRLVLVSEPKPIAVTVGAAASAFTRFAVRNAGGVRATASVSSDSSSLRVLPSSFTIEPGSVQEITVAVQNPAAMSVGSRVTVTLDAGSGVVLAVPIAFFVVESSAQTPVAWSEASVEVNVKGDAALAKIVNPNDTAAAFVAVVQKGWLSIQPTDGQTWDRPMQARETRLVRIAVDRAKRQSATGTETGTISLFTVGATDRPSRLVVVDDGPAPAVGTSMGIPSPPPGSAGWQTRILFPSLPNAADAKGIGWFSSDLWVTNTDAVNAADAELLLTPVVRPPAPGAGSVPVPTVRILTVRLAPGETRRFRNLVKVIDYLGACSLQIRSTASTVSATAVLNNEPFPQTTAALKASVSGGPVAEAQAPGSPVFGTEMRPVAPGEGAREADPQHVVTGIAWDANRRTNLLLTETSGRDTLVELRMFQSNGTPAPKGGEPFVRTITVPASQTVQINAPDLFDDPSSYVSPYFYLIATYQPGESPAGSVVPMATVVDNRTQDTSLRVGVSAAALTPSPSGSGGGGGAALVAGSGSASSLPFEGGPAPLFMPAAHAIGVPLASGAPPLWRTRVTFTNLNESEQRQMTVTFLDQTGNAPVTQMSVGLSPRGVFAYEDILKQAFAVPEAVKSYGGLRVENVQNGDGTWFSTWQDVDVQTEIYTVDPNGASEPLGEFKTGMEGYSYWHGYSSFQSNLGMAQMEGAETSSNYRTNLILQEVGGAPCEVEVAAYLPGSFIPLAKTIVSLREGDYLSRELFRNVLGLDLTDLTDVRLVVRQVSGDGIFMAFASKISLATGDPANIFLRPAMAGTGR